MIESLYEQYLQHKSVCTDTRKIEKGCIFFALKGPNFNANEFAEEALEKGASLAVIDEKIYEKSEKTFLVEDVLTTLQELAIHHRKQLEIPVIGLTGSNGKTTTKELISAVLSKKYDVCSTQGNLNNHIGVPLTILSIDEKKHDMAVVEMGANHVGEIAALCKISQPSHGFITNIGKAHLEGFGGIEGVIRGKSELYQHLILAEGVVWINSNSHILSNMSKRFKDPLFYPSKGDYYHCDLIETSPFLKLKTENGSEVSTQLVGKYNFENIAVALCIGKFFEVDENKAVEAVANYSPSNNRSQLLKRGSNTIILDAYNANPNSMASAIENLATMKEGNKVVVLGDMKELGEDSEKEHQAIIDLLQSKNIISVFLFGEEFMKVSSNLSNVFVTDEKDELKSALSDTEFANSAILIKGSRSMSLEDVVECF